MTTRTVTVERTVEEDEELDVCDGCGTSEEDSDEKLLTYTAYRHNQGNPLHFHESCYQQLNTSSPSHEDDSPSFVVRSKESFASFKDGLTNVVFSDGYVE